MPHPYIHPLTLHYALPIYHHSRHHVVKIFFFLLIRRPPRSPLFPYTPFFRSLSNTETLSPASIFSRSAGTTRKQFACASAAISPEPCHFNAFTSGILPRHSARAGKKCVSPDRSEEHTSELQSQSNLVCRLLLD